MSRWEVKQGHPNPRRQTRWDVPTQTRMQMSAMFKSDILPTRQPLRFHFSPTISGEYPSYFLTSLTGIAYACEASFWWHPVSSNFNESDRGRTRRLFMFRESEKTTEKETPGGSFFVKLCLSSPKKYKIMLERTARSTWPRITFHVSDIVLKK